MTSEPEVSGTERTWSESWSEAVEAPRVSRRGFLGKAAGIGAAGFLAGPLGAGVSAQGPSRVPVDLAGGAPEPEGSGNGGALGPENGPQRREHAFKVRHEMALANKKLPLAQHANNGDEKALPDFIASFSKGLPHNSVGEVDPGAYHSLLTALESGKPANFEKIQMGNPDPSSRFKLTSPQAGLAFDLEGTDSHQFAQPPAPAFSSAWEAGEIVENYWMALLRDVPFTHYASDPLAIEAAAELSALSDFRGPKQGGAVTAQTLLREDLPGTLVGPYASQFFWRAQPFGAQYIEPRVQTAVPGLDYLTSVTEWLAVQDGHLPPFANTLDGTLRFIRNGRDLGQWVHVDVLFQAYFQALLTLLHGPNPDPRFAGLSAPVNPGNPYNTSKTQFGFATFGGPYFAATLCEVATRALKAVWFQKWHVHRRLRPEVFAGRVHFKLTGLRPAYPIHSDVLSSAAVAKCYGQNGTYLLPMAFPEGSPTHPAYGAGHATVAGACVTILKALFDAERPWSDLAPPVVPAPDGLSLAPYTGADAAQMTVAGELNKLAANVALGRNMAGVHWRTDGIESLRLGERVALSILKDQRSCFNESFAGFQFTLFDGTPVTV
jgi:membrane-associated phospholipid phosphatase